MTEQGQHQAVTLPWKEESRRELLDYSFTIALVVILGMAVQTLLAGYVDIALIVLFVAALIYLAIYGPHSGLGSVAAVSQAGLRLEHRGWGIWPTPWRIRLARSRFLPATEIGEVRVIRESAPGISLRSTFMTHKGHKLGWGKVTVIYDTTEAVLIEQLNPSLSRPWWMLRSPQVDELARALELAREAGSEPGRSGTVR